MGDYGVEDPKGIQALLAVMLATTTGNLDASRKIV